MKALLHSNHKTFANVLVGLFLLSSKSPQITKYTAPNCKQHPKPAYLIVFKSIVRSLFADFATDIFCFFVEHNDSMVGRFKSKSVDFLVLQCTAPYKMVAQSYWELTGSVYKIASVIFGICLLFGVPWELFLFLGCCANRNRMHRWSQQRKKEAAFLVRNVQGFKSVQNKEHQHNTSTFNKNDCVITNTIHPICTSHLFLGVCY